MEYSSSAAEAYRYHHSSYDAFGGQTNTYCGNGNGLPPPASDGGVHLGMVAPARRFHPYLSSNGDHPSLAPVSGSELNGGSFTNGFSSGGQHQCDQCGVICDSPHSLSEHMQTHHFVFNDSYAPSSAHVKTELNGGSVSETAEILDLDSHKVHVYQPPGSVLGATIPFHSINGGLAPTPPYTPAASVGSASNSSSMGWMTPTPPLPPLAPPPPLHPQEYRANSFPSYEVPIAAVNGNGNNGIVTPVMKSANGWKPNPPTGGGPPVGSNGSSGNTGNSHAGGSEARRPKTYNCEACNKWFTSSGHLKRHYNTTLHKNAVKSSGGGTNAIATNDRRSTTPSSRSATTPVGAISSPAESSEEINNKTMDDTSNATQPSPKAVPPSPSHINPDYRPPSQHQQPQLVPSHQQQQQQQLQHSQVPPQLQSVSSPSYSTTPQQYQQQQQQQPQQSSNQVLDPYRSSYPTTVPVSNPAVMQMHTGVPSPGLAPPNQLNYNYGPPAVAHPSYPSVYSQHSAPQQQQQQQQQHVYPQSNTFSYPPNSIAPPLSSSNGQQLGVGPSASQCEIVQSHSAHQLPQYHSNQEQHMQQQQPFMLNNNNIIDHHHNKVGGGGGRADDTENFVLKSQDSDCSDGGGVSEGSPVGSDDADMDASDVDETDQMVKLAPSLSADFTAAVTGSKVTKRSNGTAVSSGGSNAAVGSFKCTQCDKAFNRVCYLTQHNNTFHKGDKPFKCHMCGKRFPNAELFDQHQQKHAGDKPYKCPLCPKQFNHKTDLRRHMCLHTGQKPFMCQVCNKGFIRKDHMVKHVQTHTRRNALHSQPPPAAASL